MSSSSAACNRCPATFQQIEGIWRFLPESRARFFAGFLGRYELVRAEEGWGRPDAAYFLALPEVDTGDPLWRIWGIRAANFRRFVRDVLAPLEASLGRPLKVLDLGAGNCWLAHRLALRRHHVAAVDLATGVLDGLAARVWYEADWETTTSQPFVAVQAEFDRLPYAAGLFDLAIFNASLHYVQDGARTLQEALRVLRPAGRIVVLDSPVYRNVTSGAHMVNEREARFQNAYGLVACSHATEGFLTRAGLAAWGKALGLQWQAAPETEHWRGVARSWIGHLRAGRETATFPLMVGSRSDSAPPRAAHSPAVRRLWRGLLRWRFRLIQRRRHNHLALEYVDGKPLLVLPGVFNPKLLRSGEFLARMLSRTTAESDAGSAPVLRANNKGQPSERGRPARPAAATPGGRAPRDDGPAPRATGAGGTPALRARPQEGPSDLADASITVPLIPTGGTVLDMGTGSGLGAIFAAQQASRVVAVDLNPAAVRCARINALLNGVEDRVEVREGDLFAPIGGERFDVVLFNPPYYRGKPRDALDLAWRSLDVVDRFAADLQCHLRPGGYALIVLSSDGEAAAFLQCFHEQGLSVTALASSDLINETLGIYRVSPSTAERWSKGADPL